MNHIATQSGLSATNAAAVGLTLPTGAGRRVTHAIIQVSTNSIRWRADGTDPTTTTGILVPAGGNIEFMDLAGSFIDMIKRFRAIGVSGTASLEIAYFLAGP